MGFTEIKPATTTGHADRAVLRFTDARGLTISLQGAPAQAIPVGRCRVLVDRDPVLPRLRIVADPSGPYKVGLPPKGGERCRVIRVGKAIGQIAAFEGVECPWERIDPRTTTAAIIGIDIDLPAPFRTTAKQQTAGSPSTSFSAKPRPVTVAGRVGS